MMTTCIWFENVFDQSRPISWIIENTQKLLCIYPLEVDRQKKKKKKKKKVVFFGILEIFLNYALVGSFCQVVECAVTDSEIRYYRKLKNGRKDVKNVRQMHREPKFKLLCFYLIPECCRQEDLIPLKRLMNYPLPMEKNYWSSARENQLCTSGDFGEDLSYKLRGFNLFFDPGVLHASSPIRVLG